MSDTTQTVETGTTEAPSNEAKPTVTPTSNAVDTTAEVERLKAELAKKDLRERQLQNELDKKAKAEEDARLKRLEEQEEWKTLAEQEKAKREALETDLEAKERAREIKATTSEIFSQFPKEVVELAEETGLSLQDTSEEAQQTLKEKLERIQSKVVKDAKPGPNNPGNTQPTQAPREELLKRMAYGDKEARAQIISELPAVKEMRRQAGLAE